MIECGRCGQSVEDELVAKYEGTSIEEVMYWCRSCVEDVPTAISDLFDQIEDTLTDDRPEKWRDMHVSSKALFAMKLIEDGSVTGGTVGQLETLRILMAAVLIRRYV